MRLAAWPAGLDPVELAGVLEGRPDAVSGWPPATLGELALALDHPDALVAALRGTTTPVRQAIDALLALGGRRAASALAALLEGLPGPGHEQAVDGVLGELRAAALAWPGEGDRIEVSPNLHQVVPAPLGLGPPARRIWSEQNVTAIEQAVRALGGRPTGLKTVKLETLLTLLGDAERVRQRAAQAPPSVAEGLRRMAWAGVAE